MEELIGLMVALSVAAERLVETVKGMVPFLAEANEDHKLERIRRAVLQGIAVICGISVAFTAEPILANTLPPYWNNFAGIVVIGLLASGGSGVWNAILSYLLQVKDFKKQMVRKEILTQLKESATPVSSGPTAVVQNLPSKAA